MRAPAAEMSAAGSKLVKVVQRKFIELFAARAGSSVSTSSGQSPQTRDGMRSARRRSRSRSYDGTPTTRQPPQNTWTSVTPCGRSLAEKTRGSSRIGSPSPSHTPFEPLLTSGPL